MIKVMETLIYSILHMFVDGFCALSMYGIFRHHNQWYLYLLIYNFAAFALQIIFGTLMDILKVLQNKNRIGRFSLPAACSILGVLLTISGSLTHPAILGIGNAIFHIGGGIGTIEEDYRKNLRGQALGIFVAPGALGLYLGGVIGKGIGQNLLWKIIIFTAVIMILFCIELIRYVKHKPASQTNVTMSDIVQDKTLKSIFLYFAILLCFMVVVLRSYIGINVTMTWKTGFIMGLMATLALVFGKMLGGILSARFGLLPVTIISLTISAIGYLNSNNIFWGLLALLLFNMTMPITLYLITDQMREAPGFSFGLLTLALFIGWMPAWMGAKIKIDGAMLGCGGALVTLIMLICAIWLLKKKQYI